MGYLYSFLSFLFVLLWIPALEARGKVVITRSDRKASRVVALTSLSADMVVSLDPDVLVGVPGTSLTKNDTRFKGIKRISSGRSQPRLEAIVALKPDLVVGADGFHSKILGRLNGLGIATLSFRIDRWSRLEEAAQSLQQTISNSDVLQQKLDGICPAVSGVTTSPRSRVLILIGTSPKLSPASESWSGSLLARHGLVNVTQGLSGESEFSGYITMSNERLLTVNPDTVLAVNPSGGVKQLRQSILKFLPNVQSNHVVVMDYYGLVNPGSLSSISSACQRLRHL